MTKQPDIVFSFGKNWRNFLDSLSEEKIICAEKSLKKMLQVDNFEGKRFLDAGCGSGLFSLAALRLGATEVVSFDIDEDSVACARELHSRFGPFPRWKILTGSALDKNFLKSLGKFDIVYSWGVLHHTGNMWQALENITIPTANQSKLFISIYNDQGMISKLWELIKWFYNIVPSVIKWLLSATYYFVVLAVKTAQGIIKCKPPSKWYEYGGDRGMSLWHDAVDWIGGYPFETATPEELTDFFNGKKFFLINIIKKTGIGCNELVFLSKQDGNKE